MAFNLFLSCAMVFASPRDWPIFRRLDMSPLRKVFLSLHLPPLSLWVPFQSLLRNVGAIFSQGVAYPVAPTGRNGTVFWLLFGFCQLRLLCITVGTAFIQRPARLLIKQSLPN